MRTLLARPRAVLLDEPFSKLDADLQATIRQFVFGHVRAQELPTLMVTHAAEDAQAAGGPVMRVGRHEAGPPRETFGVTRPVLSRIRPAAKPGRP
jgi:putative thiamine transport system ATP-binding protein